MINRDNIYVFFDAVGTLIHAEPAVFQVYQEFGSNHGHQLSEDVVKKRFQAAYKKYFSASSINNITSEDIEKKRWKDVVYDVFHDSDKYLFEELWNYFSLPGSWQPDESMSALVSELIDTGIHVCIASNFDARLIRICSYHFPMINTNHIFFSSNIGYSKPDTRFYKTIQGEIGLKKMEYIMIGDDPVRDIEAAQKAGWQAFNITNARNDLISYLYHPQSKTD